MINSQDIKNGVCIRMDGRLYFVIEFLHVKPGKGNTIMRVKFKDVVDGRVLERRFNIGEKLEDVRVERRPYQFLYKEGDQFNFMNTETYDQIALTEDQCGDAMKFVKENEEVTMLSHEGNIFNVDPPLFAELEVTDTEPGFKGNTATGATKPATVETGAQVMVPLFVNLGDKIQIDTRTGEYLKRV
jgi:elongation factor P